MSARRVYVPPGWPSSLPPPGTAEFEARVGSWLLERCPPDTRAHAALRSQPVVLAGIAFNHSAAAVEALRATYRQARVTILAELEPRAAEAALTSLELLGANLAAEHREVALVADALGITERTFGES